MTLGETMSLKGRQALITGAAGNIGRVLIETFAELGADLILVDRPGIGYPDIEQLQSRWRTNLKVIECDLESESDRSRLIATVRNEAHGLSILVNNAAFVGTSGLAGWVTEFEAQTVETWRRAVEVNLTAAFHLAQGMLPLLRVSKGASIINIGSIYGMHGPDYRLYSGTTMGNPAAYAASKGGLIQLTRWLATTLAPDVRVNIISPGGIFRNQHAEFVARYEARTPLGRMGTEQDLRGAAAFLASDLSAYVTGQNLAVDGGWSVW